MTTLTHAPSANAEAIVAWDGPLYDRFVQFRHIVTTGLGAHGERALALRNVREALAPRGRLVMVVWRRRSDNEWIYRAQEIVEQIVIRPDQYDEPTCGPGPFSMADADTTTDILYRAGYTNIALYRCDEPITIGASVDEAIELMMALGPAGEILRLQGHRAEHLHERVRSALRVGLADLVTPDGVIGQASTWIITAKPGVNDA
jgi:hypothetical protein